MSRPLLALTMGDPSGIGPEVLVRAVPGAPARCVALGDPAILAEAAARFAPELQVVLRETPEDVSGEEGLLEVLATGSLGEELAAGEVRAARAPLWKGAVTIPWTRPASARAPSASR